MKGERMVTVCDKCLTASCWHGEFMCWEAQSAGLIDLPVSKLDEMGLEHPSRYSAEKVALVCGRTAGDVEVEE